MRRLGDVAGAGVLAGLLAVVALLGALATGRLLLALLAVVLLVVATALVVVVVRVLDRVRELTHDVHRVTDGLREAAAAVPGADPTENTGPRPPPVPARGAGDLAALAAAVTSLQDSALTLAEAQHRSRLRASELTVHLGRRNQGLLDRLVYRIGDLAIIEHDPHAHSELQRLHHVAGRARRHAESTLVLTDVHTERVGLRPAALADVLRTALAGIEDHARVDVASVEPAAVAGSAAADVAHLAAELVDNAAQFSPPDARVEVEGARVGGSYRIRVSDRGVGMTDAQLTEANDRLRGDASIPTRLVGLDVVGRLAGRHGIDVVLDPRDGGGVVATVAVPATALVALADLPAPRRPVSALVASAAFLPPRPSPRPVPRLVPEREAAPRRARPEPTSFVRPGVPRRVPGAQLPDLGPERSDEDPRVTPDAGRVRGRLDALAAGLSAARTNNIPPLPRALADDDG